MNKKLFYKTVRLNNSKKLRNLKSRSKFGLDFLTNCDEKK